MGTKNNPGNFDCYANADPDEPMFILLGRDKMAPLLVDLWAILREATNENPAKVEEARHCANTMRAWREAIKPLLAIAFLLISVATLHAQSFPRWPDNQTVKLYTLKDAFTPDEQGRIKAAVEAWRPLLPAGLTMILVGETSHVEECQGCVTLNRETVIKSRWAECESHTNDKGLTKYAIIRIDPRAGSGDKFQRRVEHEFGHLFGMDHRPDSIMTERPHGKPGDGDAAILRGIYSSGLITRNDSKVSPPANRDSVEDKYRLDERTGNVIDISPIAQGEAANTEALKSHSWLVTVSIQTLDEDGKPNGDYSRVSRVVLDDKGRRYERVLGKHSHLKGMRITKQDEQDFLGAQMGLLDDFGRYSFHQTPNGMIQVDPISLDGKRSFKGEIKLNDKGIIEFHGTTLPGKSERFPVFTATRKEVDGHLFPSEMSSEGVLQFKSGAVRYRWKVTASDYQKFGSRVSVSEVAQ